MLGAALSAHAGNVTLYGSVDTGFMYKNHNVTANGNRLGVKENSFKLADGLNGANKIGIRGEEDFGNATVGFKLENEFNLNNGDLEESNKLFQSEARLYVRNQFGELAAGRFGGLSSAAGSYNLFFKNADAFDGGDNAIPYAFAKSDRYDNSIAYQSPDIAGFQGTLMYSFQKKGSQSNKMTDNDRYVGAGLTYSQNSMTIVGVFEGQIRANNTRNAHHKNGFTYSIGGNYDLGMAKIFVGAQWAHNTAFTDIQHGLNNKNVINNMIDQYGENMLNQLDTYLGGLWQNVTPYNKIMSELNEIYNQYRSTQSNGIDRNEMIVFDNLGDPNQLRLGIRYNNNINDEKAISPDLFKKIVKTTLPNIIQNQQYNGYALTLGSKIPLGTNEITIAGYMGEYKNAYDFLIKRKTSKINIYGLDARYEYNLSKRTVLAIGGGIGQTRINFASYKLKSRIAQTYVGLHHNF